VRVERFVRVHFAFSVGLYWLPALSPSLVAIMNNGLVVTKTTLAIDLHIVNAPLQY
jgi:hypothetical protein